VNGKGDLFIMDHGSATGNVFNTGLQTLITFVRTLSNLAEMRGVSNEDALCLMLEYPTLCLGDDQITGLGSHHIDLEEFARVEKQLWTGIVHPRKSYCGLVNTCLGSTLYGTPKEPYFLGYYILNGCPWRTEIDAWRCLMLPERPVRFVGDELIRASALRAVFWTNPDALKVINQYAGYLQWRFRDKPLIFSQGWEGERMKYAYPILRWCEASSLLDSLDRDWSEYFGESYQPQLRRSPEFNGVV
jgi:hypothetical protein